MTNKGSNDNGYFLPVHMTKSDTPNYKLIKNIPISPEKSIEYLYVLIIFPNISYEAQNIDSICSSLNIKYDVVYSEDDAKTAILRERYDLIIIDFRKYNKIININTEEIAINLKVYMKPLTCKIILYNDRPSMEFSQVWEKGYDEQWINYDNETSLKSHLESYLRNQTHKYDLLKTHSLISSVFNKFIDCIEVLKEDFTIELINGTFQSTFKILLENVKGQDWFIFHDVNEVKKATIINDLKTKKSWDGFISSKVDAQQETLNVFVVIKPLDDYSNYYIVMMNSLSGNFTKSEQSYSLYSYDRDSMAGTLSRNLDSLYNSQQISIDSPILKIMKIISSLQEIGSPMVNVQLQRIVEILSSKDLFITTVDSLKTDKISSNLIDGLLSNNATIFAQTEHRRHSSSLIKRRQTRINSEVIHDHITQILAKINKIPEVPENEEVGVIDSLLDNYSKWSFDILELERLTDNKPLRYIGMKVFTQFDLGQILNIDAKCFQNWLYVIETNYNDSNCYHNSTHAADVLQSSVWFLERDRINEIFDSYDDVISIIAAIIHDLGHPGRTNPFLINSSHSLAVLYNDVAVLENHHASFAFKVTLKDERINIFKNLNRDDYRSIRHGIIDAVLATEMAKHFEHLTKFVNSVVKVYEQHSSPISTPSNSEANLISSMDPENKAIIRRMLIKCSDVNNPTRPFHLCQEWAHRISEEYFSQTDEEISKGLPVVMPQFNRQTCDIPKSQIYFIDIFLRDMFSVWNDFANVEELLTNLHDNKEKWKKLSQDVNDNSQSITDHSKEK